MKVQSNNPIVAAKELLNQLGWVAPTDYTLEEVANCLGIIIKEVETSGSEGRILIKGDTGIISLNSNITHLGKRNFVMAHEIGHFILHKDPVALYSETQTTLSEWFKKGAQEHQANQFASELLMPELLFTSKIKNKKLEISLIKEVSTYFNVSILAALLRYMVLGSYPLMIVFMEDKIIKWKQCSTDFPFPYLPIGSPVPAYTEAGDYFNRNRLSQHSEKIEAIEWFPTAFKLQQRPDWKLWEQCYQVSDTGLVSCLWSV